MLNYSNASANPLHLEDLTVPHSKACSYS